MSMFGLESEQLVELHFGEFGVGAEELGDGLGVVLLGMAGNFHH